MLMSSVLRARAYVCMRVRVAHVDTRSFGRVYEVEVRPKLSVPHLHRIFMFVFGSRPRRLPAVPGEASQGESGGFNTDE